jgi:hypothetical protein
MTNVPNTPTEDPRSARQGVRNADVPSETLGLPDVGEGASAANFARDVPREILASDDEDAQSHAPADPRDRAAE